MGRMNRLKRDQLEKRVKEEISKSDDATENKQNQDFKNEKTLEMVMNEDAVMAQVYQEVYNEVKETSEAESHYLKELHDKFDYYYDKEKMGNKLGTDWYDPADIDNYDYMDFSTEWTSESDDVQYKRYKMQKQTVRTGIKEYEEIMVVLMREAESWRPKLDDDNSVLDENDNKIANNAHTMMAKIREMK